MKKINIQKKLWLEISLLLVTLLSLSISVSAQETEKSAQDEFENYGRNPKFVKPPPKPIKTPPKPIKTPSKPTKTSKPVNTPSKPSKPTISSVGKPGMKIWVERKIGGKDSFFRVVPTTVFKSGDWVRFNFRLNFNGYLVIFYRGSSGETDIIFPQNQTNNIVPKTNYLIPDKEGLQFDDNVGNEELLFIVSRKPLNDKLVKQLSATRDFESETEVSVQAVDRDLIKPKTEKDEVYVLSNDTRLEKPLVFRMLLRHR